MPPEPRRLRPFFFGFIVVFVSLVSFLCYYVVYVILPFLFTITSLWCLLYWSSSLLGFILFYGVGLFSDLFVGFRGFC